MKWSKTLSLLRRYFSVETVALVVAFFSSLLASPAQACDFCMLGQGVSPYLTASGHGLTLDLSSIVSDHLYDKSTNIDSLGKKESWLVYSMTGFFPVTDDLTLMVTLPYVAKTNVDFDSTTGLNSGTYSEGVGDTTLTGRYTLIRHHSLESTWIGGVLAGIKIPTGSNSQLDRSGEPLDRHALPGTGSFDYNLGFTSSFTRANGFQLTLDVVYSIAGAGKWDDRDHRYGNTLNASVKGYYRVAQNQTGSSLFPFLGISAESMGEEKGAQTDLGYQSGLMNLSSGGTVLFGDFGLYAILNPSTFLNLAFSKAFYRYMNFDSGFDADPAENYKTNISITYLF